MSRSPRSNPSLPHAPDSPARNGALLVLRSCLRQGFVSPNCSTLVWGDLPEARRWPVRNGSGRKGLSSMLMSHS